MSKHSIQYGNATIKFKLEFSLRKTLGIEVHPDAKVFVLAPNDSSLQKIKDKVKSKAHWILKQQDFFLQFHPITPKRKFVSGESHKYLGRQYRLKIIKSKSESVKLTRGKFEIKTKQKSNKKGLESQLKGWYEVKAGAYFDKLLLELNAIKNSIYEGNVNLKNRWMTKRWGSCSAKGTITLNNELIKAPKKCIEYVIIHELCHLAFLNHSKAFYRLLEKHCPDWRRRKEELERFMV
jgi:predicted metal-dependent hydrolase